MKRAIARMRDTERDRDREWRLAVGGGGWGVEEVSQIGLSLMWLDQSVNHDHHPASIMNNHNA